MQHYPNEKRVIIVLADFGLGIPATVRRVHQDLGDGDAIVKATENGFTSKSIATNQGYGLDILLKTVVEGNRGWVTIYSGTGIVKFEAKETASGTKSEPCVKSGVGLCPGTTIEIKLRTDTLVEPTDEEQDFEW